jgi:hypothetical protein
VALELPEHIIVFRDDGVHKHRLTAGAHHLPKGTWALSGSNEETVQPCGVFLRAAKAKNAWIVQTTSPSETKYKAWEKEREATMFVMDYFSIDEITALGLV